MSGKEPQSEMVKTIDRLIDRIRRLEERNYNLKRRLDELQSGRRRSVEQEVEDFRRASEQFRARMRRDPEVAKDFLISAGIVQRNEDRPSGVAGRLLWPNARHD